MSGPTGEPNAQRAPLAQRLQWRDEFFGGLINPRQLLAAFDQIPGIRYFVKDARSRVMALSARRVQQLGLSSENEVIGLTDREYLPAEIVGDFLADDQWVIRHGKPLRNRIEMGMDEIGFRDWTITDKYPLTDTRGKVVGLIGTIQFFETRRQMLESLGPIGKAAELIRDHLGDGLMVGEIARRTGISERQLQRLFRKSFGMSVQQFIIRSRLQAAIHELTRTRRTIAEIALMFGFSDQSAFTNQFRSLTGMPPSRYRQLSLTQATKLHARPFRTDVTSN